MDRHDLAIIEAARAEGVNVTKNAAGRWEVGLSTATDVPTAAKPRQADAFLAGGTIRLAGGRTLKREMTDEEARKEFGLD
jgi:hypothetical protein